MPLLSSLFAMAMAAAVPGAAADPCPNGSFDQLAPNGFPADWSPVGPGVEPVRDAHSGQYALRLRRAPGTPASVETGINGPWRAVGGKAVLVDRLHGGLDFWYKAVSGQDANLRIYVVPMNAEPREGTRSPRAHYTVPKEHVGDGQWHHARLKFDFRKDPSVKWALFASRIEGAAGELLLDDFAYVEQVGPLVHLGKVWLEEDPKQPGRRCTITVRVDNGGDAPAKDVRATLKLPDGLSAAATELRLGDLGADASAPAKWLVEGDRARAGTLGVEAGSGPIKATAGLALAPKLTLQSFGPVAPVALVGKPIALECVLENSGNAAVLRPAAEFTLGADRAQATAERIEPGRSVVLKAVFHPKAETPAIEATMQARAENVKEALVARSSLTVGSAVELPPPSGKPQAVSARDYALLENEHLRLAFRRNAFGFGPGELAVKTSSGWHTVAWMPRLSYLAWRVTKTVSGFQSKDFHTEHRVPVHAVVSPREENYPLGPARLRFVLGDVAGHPFGLQATFTLAPGGKMISARYELTPPLPGDSLPAPRLGLLAFEGPMLYVLDRDEAVFPGLEWLVDDEVSSGTLEIAEGHADRIRYVVHPNYVTIPAMGVHGKHGTVGLVWDVHQRWGGRGGREGRPSAVFASPDRFQNQRAHLMGLFVPGVPGHVERNKREAAKPYGLAGPVALECQIYADGSAADPLAAVDAWARRYGIPEPPPLPRGSFEKEIEFSMQGYLKSLWLPESKEWWTSKGGGTMSDKGRPPSFVADLLLGEVLSPDPEVRRQCRARADEVLKLLGGEPRIDAQRFPGPFDHLFAHPGTAAGLLGARGEDGAWRFDADQIGTGPFVGLDYHDLGPDEAVELGTCAQKAFEVLRYARVTGDREAFRQMLPTLELMERFRVPRAAQVWEVPVHAPDILAAADAVDAYVEAYRVSGDPRWLSDAVFWARRGLPFVYLWAEPQRPFLLGGSIPVFGATWMQGSWFARPVQWNGLRYAEAILKVAEHDKSYPWRRIAELVVRSALVQQDTAGENVALWPDNVGAIEGDKCPWMFAPREVLHTMLKLMDRDEDPATVILGQGERRLHVTAAAKIRSAAWDGDTCSFSVTYPRGEQGVVLVCNVARPKAVLLSAKPVGEREDIQKGTEAGWRYDEGNACLAVRVPRDGESPLRIEGAAWRYVDRLPQTVRQIAFELDNRLEGWLAANHVAGLRIDRGALAGRITGGDPFLVRMGLRVAGDSCPVLRLRMRVTAGQGGEFYWTTASSPGFAPDKLVGFPLLADGQWHEYRIEPGKHPLWAGQTITGIRIDPGNGVPEGEFAIDYVRGGQ